MIGVDSDKIDQYIEIASGAGNTAEVSTIEDPFTRSVTSSFYACKGPWFRSLVFRS